MPTDNPRSFRLKFWNLPRGNGLIENKSAKTPAAMAE
jgi:hypothetical protein